MITTQSEKEKKIVFDDMIADIMGSKTFQAIIKELFIRCRRLNFSLVFISQPIFYVPKDVRLDTTHFFMKISNRIELKNTPTDHSADIEYNDFKKIYRDCRKNHIIF